MDRTYNAIEQVLLAEGWKPLESTARTAERMWTHDYFPHAIFSTQSAALFSPFTARKAAA